MEEVAVNQKKIGKSEVYILGVYITLFLFSIIESYSASSREIAMSGSIFMPMLKHLFILCSGAGLMYWISRMSLSKLMRFSVFFTALTVVGMVWVLFFGANLNSGQRWVSLGIATVQPSEFAKVAVVFILSYLLASNIDKKTGIISTKGLIICVSVVTIFGGLLLLQGLTNTLLFMGISFSILIVGGTKWSQLGKVLLVYMVVGLLFLLIKTAVSDSDSGDSALRVDTWSSRIDSFLGMYFGPPAYTIPITSDNDQAMYSFMAQGNGGLAGVGIGNSRECSRLPLAFSDYVFAIIVEDLGFIGGLFLVIVYFKLLQRASGLAQRCSNAYPSFLAMGMAVLIALQAFFHMAITTGLFPVSGQPLPLISKGGSSIWVTSVAFGVMLCVSRHAVRTGKKTEARKEKESLPEALRADNPTMDE